MKVILVNFIQVLYVHYSVRYFRVTVFIQDISKSIAYHNKSDNNCYIYPTLDGLAPHHKRVCEGGPMPSDPGGLQVH